MKNFKAIAEKTLSLSPLMSGRTQLKTDDIINHEVTIIAFDFATIADKDGEKVFPVFNFKEYPDRYYNGGTLLMKLALAWAAEFDGDPEAASDALNEEGGVKVKFIATRTKSGNNLTSMIVL